MAESFNANVLSKAVMKKRLLEPVYKAVLRTIDRGEKLNCSFADVLASAMKDCTHFRLLRVLPSGSLALAVYKSLYSYLLDRGGIDKPFIAAAKPDNFTSRSRSGLHHSPDDGIQARAITSE